VAWMKNVSQRNAPGAISAIALLVSPVRPSVGFISPYWYQPSVSVCQSC
jgi:hypothetical protein